MHSWVPYFAVIFAAAVLNDASNEIAKSNVRGDQVLFLPLWAINGGLGEAAMVGLRLFGVLGIYSAWIAAFFLITPWYLAPVLIVASSFAVPIGVLMHLLPRSVILRLFTGVVLLLVTFCNYVFQWLP